MQEEISNQDKFYILNKFVSQITEMQNYLVERDKINMELETEIAQLKLVVEEARAGKDSLEEQLLNSNFENELLKEKLQQEENERKRIEEEFKAVTTSLKEQLTKRDAEKELIKKNLQQEIEKRKEALGKLLQSVNQVNTFFGTDSNI